MVKNEPTFLHSCILDGTGGAKFVDASSVAGWTKDQGVLWVHLDVNDDASRLWLAEHGGLDSTIVESLLADETRPRSYSTDHGLLTVLRGVNTNPGEDPEDMVSVRLWIEPDRIISTRRRRLLSIVDTRDSLEKGVGPETSGGFMAALTGRMADRIGDFVDGIEDDVGAAEEQLGNQDQATFRHVISALRRKIASVRRFLAPQRDALDRLYRQPGLWFSNTEIHDMREECRRTPRAGKPSGLSRLCRDHDRGCGGPFVFLSMEEVALVVTSQQVGHREFPANDHQQAQTKPVRDRQPNTPREFHPRHVFLSNCQLGYGFGYLSRPVLITAWGRRTNL